MCMRWLKRMLTHPEPEPSSLVEGVCLEDEKRRRISTLSGDEQKAFEWFRQGYTANWTAETMLLDRKTARRLFGSLFLKLEVANEAELCRLYRTAPLQPKDIPPEEDGL